MTSMTSRHGKNPRVIPPKPPRPLNEYHIFFQLERNYILQNPSEDEGGESSSNSNVDTTVDFADIDPHASTRPPKYRSLVLPCQWHTKGSRPKSRSQRKTHGKISFLEMTKLISQRWREADQLTKSYCRELGERELKRYREEMKEYVARYGQEAIRLSKVGKSKKARKKSQPRSGIRNTKGGGGENKAGDRANSDEANGLVQENLNFPPKNQATVMDVQGQMKLPAAVAIVQKACTAAASQDFSEFYVNSFALMQSQLEQQAMIHQLLKQKQQLLNQQREFLNNPTFFTGMMMSSREQDTMTPQVSQGQWSRSGPRIQATEDYWQSVHNQTETRETIPCQEVQAMNRGWRRRMKPQVHGNQGQPRGMIDPRQLQNHGNNNIAEIRDRDHPAMINQIKGRDNISMNINVMTTCTAKDQVPPLFEEKQHYNQHDEFADETRGQDERATMNQFKSRDNINLNENVTTACAAKDQGQLPPLFEDKQYHDLHDGLALNSPLLDGCSDDEFNSFNGNADEMSTGSFENHPIVGPMGICPMSPTASPDSLKAYALEVGGTNNEEGLEGTVSLDAPNRTKSISPVPEYNIAPEISFLAKNFVKEFSRYLNHDHEVQKNDLDALNINNQENSQGVALDCHQRVEKQALNGMLDSPLNHDGGLQEKGVYFDMLGTSSPKGKDPNARVNDYTGMYCMPLGGCDPDSSTPFKRRGTANATDGIVKDCAYRLDASMGTSAYDSPKPAKRPTQDQQMFPSNLAACSDATTAKKRRHNSATDAMSKDMSREDIEAWMKKVMNSHGGPTPL